MKNEEQKTRSCWLCKHFSGGGSGKDGTCMKIRKIKGVGYGVLFNADKIPSNCPL